MALHNEGIELARRGNDDRFREKVCSGREDDPALGVERGLNCCRAIVDAQWIGAVIKNNVSIRGIQTARLHRRPAVSWIIDEDDGLIFSDVDDSSISDCNRVILQALSIANDG